MATASFEMSLDIDTDEAAENLLKALDEADRRGSVKLPDFSDAFARGEVFSRRGPPQ